jgi:hypothetical protein
VCLSILDGVERLVECKVTNDVEGKPVQSFGNVDTLGGIATELSDLRNEHVYILMYNFLGSESFPLNVAESAFRCILSSIVSRTEAVLGCFLLEL